MVRTSYVNKSVRTCIRKVENVGQGGTSTTQLGHDEQDLPAHELNDLPDNVLIELIVSGKQAAFSAIVYRYTDRYLALAERVLYDRAEAEDTVQEAFMRLWKNAHTFNADKAKFSTWFYRIVLNRCLDKKRKKKPIALPENYDVKDESLNQEEKMNEGQRSRLIREQLDGLPENQKNAIILCYFEEMSNKEAAIVLELNIKALESLLTRGRKTLAQKLANSSEQLLRPL